MSQVNITEIISQPGSERAILSICLNQPEKIIEVEGFGIRPDHFAIEAHRYIYMAVGFLYNRSEGIDPLSVYNVLSDQTARAALETIGGMEYVDSLVQAPVSSNISLFCEQVKRSYSLRQIYDLVDRTKDELLRNPDNVDAQNLLSDLEQRVIEISLNNEVVDGVYQMGQDAEERFNERLNNPTDIIGMPLGFPKLDRATGGAGRGELILIVAESKTGKSVTLLNMSKFIVVDLDLPLLYIDTEMYQHEQEDRLLAIISQVPEEEIITGKFATDTVYGSADQKINAYKQAMILLRTKKFFHVYMPDFTVDKIKALVRKYQMQHNIQAVIFDYIQMPSAEAGSLKYIQEHQALGMLTAGLKDLAGKCQIPILSAAQENRSGVGSTIKDARNLGGSYKILQKASKLIFLRNKTDEELAMEGPLKGNQKFKIAYQRRGGSDLPEINVMFDRPRITQREVD